MRTPQEIEAQLRQENPEIDGNAESHADYEATIALWTDRKYAAEEAEAAAAAARADQEALAATLAGQLELIGQMVPVLESHAGDTAARLERLENGLAKTLRHYAAKNGLIIP